MRLRAFHVTCDDEAVVVVAASMSEAVENWRLHYRDEDDTVVGDLTDPDNVVHLGDAMISDDVASWIMDGKPDQTEEPE
jgi:hypothetical protein